MIRRAGEAHRLNFHVGFYPRRVADPRMNKCSRKKIVRVRGDNKAINRARFLRRVARSVLQCVYVDVVAVGCFAHAKLDTRSGILSRHAFRENRYPAVSLMRENGIVCKKKS